MIAQWDSPLSGLPVARVQFPVVAEYFKGFIPGWSHALRCTHFREDRRAEWRRLEKMPSVSWRLWVAWSTSLPFLHLSELRQSTSDDDFFSLLFALSRCSWCRLSLTVLNEANCKRFSKRVFGSPTWQTSYAWGLLKWWELGIMRENYFHRGRSALLGVEPSILLSQAP